MSTGARCAALPSDLLREGLLGKRLLQKLLHCILLHVAASPNGGSPDHHGVGVEVLVSVYRIVGL